MTRFIKFVLICVTLTQLMGCAAAVVGGALASKKYIDHANKKESESLAIPNNLEKGNSTKSEGSSMSTESDNTPVVPDSKISTIEIPADYTGIIFEGEASTKEDACLAANISANFEPKYQGEFPCSCARSTLWLCKVYPDKK